MGDHRSATVKRTTHETDISIAIELDSLKESSIKSGVPFFDHMLSSFARHGRISIDLCCKGDTHIDDHHSVEDIGICLGKALLRALGDRAGITRFGFASIPMDDALARVSIDISGRPWFHYDGPELRGKIGAYDAELTKEFLQSVAFNAQINLHVDLVRGDNAHHIHEAIFKSFGVALRLAAAVDPSLEGSVPSTKGVL
jgi:imidazoleglycerol-phosphate dehydratase